MKRQLLFHRVGSAGYILLGLVHVLVEYFDTADNQVPAFGHMRSFVPSAFADSGVSLFDFYKGYSYMMGVLAIAFGIQALTGRRHWSTLLLSLVALFIAVIHFPLLVWGFILVCTLCYGIAALPGKRTVM